MSSTQSTLTTNACPHPGCNAPEADNWLDVCRHWHCSGGHAWSFCTVHRTPVGEHASTGAFTCFECFECFWDTFPEVRRAELVQEAKEGLAAALRTMGEELARADTEKYAKAPKCPIPGCGQPTAKKCSDGHEVCLRNHHWSVCHRHFKPYDAGARPQLICAECATGNVENSVSNHNNTVSATTTTTSV
jgi:hypothetical protein